MPEVQVFDDALGREKPKTYLEFQDRMKPIIQKDYADLDMASASVTRGGENIRYNQLMAEAYRVAGWPNQTLRLEFFRDLHFWTGIPRSEMLQWKDRDILHRMVKITFEVMAEARKQK
jgi:hypothetical protein